MILGKGKTHDNILYMASSKGRIVETMLKKCQDYLCPYETRIKEWFPTALQAKIRAKALDPFGNMKMNTQTRNNDNGTNINFICQDEMCHAYLRLKKVKPDSEGNNWGLFGCFAHQHPITRNKKSEIVFENKEKAIEFYNEHLRRMYTITDR